jgi:hypothetical protein
MGIRQPRERVKAYYKDNELFDRDINALSLKCHLVGNGTLIVFEQDKPIDIKQLKLPGLIMVHTVVLVLPTKRKRPTRYYNLRGYRNRATAWRRLDDRIDWSRYPDVVFQTNPCWKAKERKPPKAHRKVGKKLNL